MTEGHRDDPRSLHKYLYGDDDPITNADPAGHQISEVGTLTVLDILVAAAVLTLTIVLTKVEDELLKKTFYRGTTYYDAEEVVQNQAINISRLMQNQTNNPYLDLGPGLYLTKSKSTADVFAAYSGVGRRQGGPAVLRITIEPFLWANLLKWGALEDVPISGMPGQLQTWVPLPYVPYFSASAQFYLEHP